MNTAPVEFDQQTMHFVMAAVRDTLDRLEERLIGPRRPTPFIIEQRDIAKRTLEQLTQTYNQMPA